MGSKKENRDDFKIDIDIDDKKKKDSLDSPFVEEADFLDGKKSNARTIPPADDDEEEYIIGIQSARKKRQGRTMSRKELEDRKQRAVYNDGFENIESLEEGEDESEETEKRWKRGAIGSFITSLYFPVFLLVNELILRFFCGLDFLGNSFFTILFTLAAGFLLSFAVTLLPKGFNRFTARALTFLISAYVALQVICRNHSGSFFALVNKNAPGLEYVMSDILTAAYENIIPLCVILAVFICAFLSVGKVFAFKMTGLKGKVLLVLLTAAVYLCAYFSCISYSAENEMYLNGAFDVNESMSRFGVAQTLVLDLKGQ